MGLRLSDIFFYDFRLKTFLDVLNLHVIVASSLNQCGRDLRKHIKEVGIQTEIFFIVYHYKKTTLLMLNYYMTKAVRGLITKINQSDYFIFGPARADIFPVSDRVLSRTIPRDSAQDFCLLNQDSRKYERYFS